MAETLEGKIAAVTGAASGIGLSTTRALLHAGARVVMVDRDAQALSTLSGELGDNVIAQRTDLLEVGRSARAQLEPARQRRHGAQPTNRADCERCAATAASPTLVQS